MLLPDIDVGHIPRILMALKSRAAARVLQNLPERPPRLWQAGGGHDRNVGSHRQFLEAVDYIEHNPVIRGLVARPEEYRWSSAGCPFLGRDPW